MSQPRESPDRGWDKTRQAEPITLLTSRANTVRGAANKSVAPDGGSVMHACIASSSRNFSLARSLSLSSFLPTLSFLRSGRKFSRSVGEKSKRRGKKKKKKKGKIVSGLVRFLIVSLRSRWPAGFAFVSRLSTNY